MESLSYRFHRLTRPYKIKLGNQKERLSDLERFWYYDPYFVDYALHDDTGKPWKIHKKRINPLTFAPIIQIVRNIERYGVQTALAVFMLFFAVTMNYGSQLIDWITSYNIQVQEMLDEREREEAERRERLLALTAAGFEQKITPDAKDDISEDVYEKADHLTMDELELSGDTDNPLTSSNILTAEDIKDVLSTTWVYNKGLSEEEYRIVKSALLTVGRIPYVLGGAQPTRPSNTEKDDSGFPIVPDDAIVSFANQITGMDCSHYVDWIYYIALNDNLGYCNTDSMIYTKGNGSLKLIAVDENGTEYDQGLSNIRAGDIMVYGHDGSHRFGHAGIFLGYINHSGDSTRDMMYVHESSAAGNVSLHVGDPFGNNGSSPVFYYRYKTLDGTGIEYDYDYLRKLQAGTGSSSSDYEKEDPEEDDTLDEELEEEEEDEDVKEDEDDDDDSSVSDGDDDSGNVTRDEDDVEDDGDDEDEDDDDDDDLDDEDSETYKQYVQDKEAEDYKPTDPVNDEMDFGNDLEVAPQ